MEVSKVSRENVNVRIFSTHLTIKLKLSATLIALCQFTAEVVTSDSEYHNESNTVGTISLNILGMEADFEIYNPFKNTFGIFFSAKTIGILYKSK